MGRTPQRRQDPAAVPVALAPALMAPFQAARIERADLERLAGKRLVTGETDHRKDLKLLGNPFQDCSVPSPRIGGRLGWGPARIR
jgi:hypothetical protein